MKTAITIKGQHPGPTSTIIVGNHGNETCGIVALDSLIDNLTINRGTLYIIYGNPRAIEKNVRYTDMNLNRAFKIDDSYSDLEKESYEYKRAQYIKTYLDQSDALLDIHSAKKPTDPFIFCEQASVDIARSLSHKVKRIVTGIDAVEPGGTDGYMHRQGKIGICIECGQHDDESAIHVATEAIENFLISIGHIDKDKKIYNSKQYHLDYAYYTKTNSFLLEKEFEDFSQINKDDLIGKDGNENVNSPLTGIILFARNCSKTGLEGFLVGKEIPSRANIEK